MLTRLLGRIPFIFVAALMFVTGALATGWQTWRMMPHSTTGETAVAVAVTAMWLILPSLGVAAALGVKAAHDPEWGWHDWLMGVFFLLIAGSFVVWGFVCADWLADQGRPKPAAGGMFFAFYAAFGPLGIATLMDTRREAALRQRRAAAAAQESPEPA